MTSPVSPPADDQVREAAVEAVARLLWLREDGAAQVDHDWDMPSFSGIRGYFRDVAEQVLSLPDVSALVDKARIDGEAAVAEALSDAAQLTRHVADSLSRRAAERHYRADQARAAIRQTEGNNR